MTVGSKLFLTLCLALLLTVQPALAQMVTPGSFGVSESGAATYTIPIQVPPGTAGIEPKLALVYSSQSGNGLLGVGWSLSGLSAIGRCPRTMAQDGVRGGVNYDTNDRFCLDGQRLVVVSGSYGAAGSEYRTERESFSKITANGTANGAAANGPASFTVKTKAGLIMEYGATADSAIEAQGKTVIRTWALNKISDTKDNYLTISYTEDNANGQFYPARIDYTGNTTTGTTPTNTVFFEYEARPDVVPMYHAGSLIKNTVRLNRLRTVTGSGATDIKQYLFGFSTSSAANRTRLVNLTECGASGTCTPATSASYQDFGAIGYSASSTWFAGYGTVAGVWTDNNTYPRFLVDVNGDGLPDIVGFSSIGVVVSLNTGNAFGPSLSWCSGYGTSSGWSDNATYPRLLADVNGDGLPDVVGFSSSGVLVSLNTGNSFGSAQLWSNTYGTSTGWSDNNTYPRFVVDVDGDGLPDIIGFSSTGVLVSLNTGSGFSAPKSWIAAYGTQAGAWSDNNVYPRFVVDVNDDGLPDIVGFSSVGVVVSLNTGTSFSPATMWYPGNFGTSAGAWSDNATYPRLMVDVNADGLPDIVGFSSTGVIVALNTGSGFSSATQWASGYGTSSGWSDQGRYPRDIVDVNGDGLPDIVGFSSTGVSISLNGGTAFGPATQWFSGYGTSTGGWTDTNTYPRFIVDIDGDGLPDIVGFASQGVQVATSASHKLPDVISALQLPLNRAITPSYSPLPQLQGTRYQKELTPTFPQIAITPALQVVTDVDTGDGVGGTRRTSYSYGTAVAEVGTGRGFLGFNWVQSQDVATGLVSHSIYRQDFPYSGLVDQVWQGTGTSSAAELKNLGQSTNTYTCTDFVSASGCVVAAGKRYFVSSNQTDQKRWDLNGTALPITRTTQTFDTYGNATAVTVSTLNADGSASGYSKSTVSTYANDTTNWILGRLLKSTVTSTTP